MATRKIVCLGGGSFYFMRALPDLLLSEDLAGSEVVLYDIDGEKADLMAAMGRRLASQASTGFQIRATTDLADAVDGADFALSSIGGSGAEISGQVYASYYHSCDVYIPARYGIYQVVGDTGGPGGMMMGLRSIAAYMPICRELEKRAPRVIVLNHSNPMAPLCRAMTKYTGLTVLGICHGVQIGVCHAAQILGLDARELECAWIGTNHYYWLTQLRHGRQDLYPELLRRMAAEPPAHGEELSTRLTLIYGYKVLYPEDDHIWEFYPFATAVRDHHAPPYGLAETARRFGYDPSKPLGPRPLPTPDVRRQFLQNYRKILDEQQLPKERGDRITGEGIGSLVGAIANGRRELAIVNIPNRGLIPNLPPTGIVEVEGVTDSQGVRGIQTGEAPVYLKGLLEKRFAWQELVADAAVKGDRNLALQALLLDEMAILPDPAEAMLDELLAASRDLLPQFFRH
jgi:alpha-galactosidase